MVLAEFVVNNNAHTATKVLPFIANYGRELRMERYKKKGKGRKGNGVCRENEEST